MSKKKGQQYFDGTFVHKFDNATIIGLLLTLVKIANSTKDWFEHG